jgi:hypothetical protein
MPFSMRVGKGVRLSASPRGLRAHVGPRKARMHFGSGRTGVSTGTGPITYYTSLGGGSRRSSSDHTAGPSQRQLAQAQKEEEFLRLRSILQEILDVHRTEFPKAERQLAPPPAPVDERQIYKAKEKELLAGVPVWRIADRKAAKARARKLASEEVQRENERRSNEQAALQRELDEVWERLCTNHPSTVIDAIDDAFEDNEAPAAPVNMEESVLSLVMLAPTEDQIPEQKPAVTPSGKPTVKRMTKTEGADVYLTLISGHLLATIREALAVAPGIEEVKAVVVRRTEDIYGETHLEALMAGRYGRAQLERVKWKEAEAPTIVQQAALELNWNPKGRPPTLKPLGLDKEPGLKTFLDALEGPVSPRDEERGKARPFGPTADDDIDVDEMVEEDYPED